ncbi:hypothetical protein JIG36_40645 [Actinoplanes sp. LDG1-06]|uniref:Uncharacterized protein n=1 Tax=Paractinoplanes ovalisporus TaxID=2810368 RepID=A0ABS2APP9_9ACTN|nr:hypothetical protein [Actinoplanes ovalisporus]MBM2621832.1 hypothetical protein [Actinoplanes ovalisporus]
MKVGGRDFDLTKQEVETRMMGEDPELIQKHMVKVNGQMFPPKQILGHVTGWERTSFTTMEAQRVLTRIGFVCTEARAGRIAQAGQFIMDTFRDSVQETMSDHGDAHFARGFSAAADITLRQIQKRLNDLRGQMKGAGLSQAEQTFYAHLDELESEIVADCDRYWRGSGVDWRPLMPTAKAAVRRPDETRS